MTVALPEREMVAPPAVYKYRPAALRLLWKLLLPGMVSTGEPIPTLNVTAAAAGMASAIDAIAANFSIFVIVLLPSTMRLPSRAQFKQSLNERKVTYFLPL